MASQTLTTVVTPYFFSSCTETRGVNQKETGEFRLWRPLKCLSREVLDTDAHLDELVECGVGGIVGNEEPHVFVGDLHRGRSVHTSHRDNVKRKKPTKPKSLPRS